MPSFIKVYFLNFVELGESVDAGVASFGWRFAFLFWLWG